MTCHVKSQLPKSFPSQCTIITGPQISGFLLDAGHCSEVGGRSIVTPRIANVGARRSIVSCKLRQRGKTGLHRRPRFSRCSCLCAVQRRGVPSVQGKAVSLSLLHTTLSRVCSITEGGFAMVNFQALGQHGYNTPKEAGAESLAPW